MIKKRFTISGMHCTSCSMLIEGELGDIGVTATCNYAKGYVDVAWDEKKVKEKDIVGVIERLGYSVNEMS